MTSEATDILVQLRAVASERQLRASDAALSAQVLQVKAFQHQRFAATYADLAAQARYAGATRFFLDDLYGPHDFSERDEQFVRIVPALVRLFPIEIVQTVRALAALHALSERLDTLMAQQLATPALDATAYQAAWQAVARAADREQQIVLLLAVGGALDRLTRNPLLRHSLKLMRGPAKAAGLAALQGFLERGFDTFKGMRGAREFLDTVAARERSLASLLFAGEAVSSGTLSLGQVP